MSSSSLRAAAPAASRAAPVPAQESDRLRVLRSFNLLDTLPEQMFDDIVKVASSVCGTPIALISLLDAERQWFKAKVGLEADQTPREHAFCAHAIMKPEETMVVPDATQDERFADNPLVTGNPDIRMYAGAPIVSRSGHALGTVCVIDTTPRELTPMQLEALQALSRQAANLIEFRRLSRNSLDAAQLQLLDKSDKLREAQQLAERQTRLLQVKARNFAMEAVEPLQLIAQQLECSDAAQAAALARSVAALRETANALLSELGVAPADLL